MAHTSYYAVGTQNYWVCEHPEFTRCFTFEPSYVSHSISPEDIPDEEKMYRIFKVNASKKAVVMTWGEFCDDALQETYFEVGQKEDDSNVYCLMNLSTNEILRRKKNKWYQSFHFEMPHDAVFSSLVKLDEKTIGITNCTSREVEYYRDKVTSNAFFHQVCKSLNFPCSDDGSKN